MSEKIDLRGYHAFAEPVMGDAAPTRAHLLPPGSIHALLAGCWCHPRELGPEAAELFGGELAVWIHQPIAPRWG